MATADDKVDRFTLTFPPLAQGQHTAVWEATDGAQRLAMKLLLDHAYKDPVQKTSLKTEYQIGKNFDHPNIIKYYELAMNKHHGYFTMELFRAPNLKAQIYNDHRGVMIRIKRIIELVSLALEHVHEKGWIHKDIKPDNILVNKAGEIRLIDFSLGGKPSSALGKLFGRKAKLVQGTRSYMSPEQILANPLTPATDQYSFGITLFECLTGQTPFKGATPKDLLIRHCNERPPAPSFLNPNVTPEMDRLVLRLLEKKPEKRFKNMSEFLLEFRRVNVWKEPVEDTPDKKPEDDIDLTLGERRDSRSDALRSEKAAAEGALTRQSAAAAQPAVPAKIPAAAKSPAPVNQPASIKPPAVAKPAAQPVKGPPAAKAPVPGIAKPNPAAAVRPQPAIQGQGAVAKVPPPQALASKAAKPPPARSPAPAAAQPSKPLAQQPPAARPAPMAPRPPVKAPPRPASAKTPPPADSDALNINDLPNFDELPPVL